MSDGMSAPQRKNAAWATGRSTPARSTNPAITATDPSAPPGPCELLPPPRTYASGSPSRLAATSSVFVLPPSTPRTTTFTRTRAPAGRTRNDRRSRPDPRRGRRGRSGTRATPSARPPARTPPAQPHSRQPRRGRRAGTATAAFPAGTRTDPAPSGRPPRDTCPDPGAPAATRRRPCARSLRRSRRGRSPRVAAPPQRELRPAGRLRCGRRSRSGSHRATRARRAPVAACARRAGRSPRPPPPPPRAGCPRREGVRPLRAAPAPRPRRRTGACRRPSRRGRRRCPPRSGAEARRATRRPRLPRRRRTRPRSRPREVLPVRVDHPVRELLRDLGLTDERVREQRAEDALPPAVQGGIQREVFVRGDVCDESAVHRVERRHRQWLDSARTDARRHLDHRVVGEKRQRAVVAEVDHVAPLAAATEQARHELDGRLGVAGAAAPPQELRLLVERLVGVEVQQLALDLGHFLGTRLAVPLLLDDVVVLVEVVQVVRGHDPKSLHEPGWQAGGAGDALRVLVEHPRENVGPVEPHADLPRQVVEADVVELDPLRRDIEQSREVSLEG